MGNLESKLKDLHALKNQYLDFLKNEKRYSEKTCVAYNFDLSAFESFIAKHQFNFLTLGLDEIKTFFFERQAHDVSPKTLQRLRSAIRGFYRYLIHEEAIETTDPTAALRLPKAPRLLPHVLDVDALKAFLDNETNHKLWIRDKAIFEVLYSAGLRVSECANLNVQDVNLADGTLIVLGKGNKTRIGLLGLEAKKALSAWLTQRETYHAASQNAVFLSTHNRRMTVRTIQKRLEFYQKLFGLSEKIHPHLLRHCFASHLLESSGDLRAVQELLGHANLATTEIYTQLNFQHLSSIYDDCHPRARMKRRK